MFKKGTRPASEPDQKGPQYLHGLPLAILFAAIPAITTYFGTVEDVDWYGTAYLLSLCAIQPLTGQLYNVFRVKFTFLTFVSLFLIGNLIAALARSSKVFIVGRAVAGGGSAGLFNGCMVIITAATPPNLRAQLLSISVVMVGIGGVIGPVVSGAITEHLGWRWCLWILLPCAGANTVALILLRIPDQMEKAPARSVVRQLHQKLDFIGFFLFTPACVMFLLAMSWGGSRFAWKSATIIALFVSSGVAIAIFAGWIRYYQERALIPPHVLKKPVVLYGCIISCLQGAGFLMVNYYLPLWFQSVKGASPQKGGLMMLPSCITQIVAGLSCAFLLKKIPYAPLWTIFGNTSVAVGCGLITTFHPSTTEGQWIGYQILVGAGRGVAMQMPVLAAQAVLSSSEISIATANYLFFQYFGGAVAQCIAKTIFINSLGPALRHYAPNIDPQQVINAGATEVFKTVAPEDLHGLVLAYNQALTLPFWLAAATTAAGVFFSFGLGWHRVQVKIESPGAVKPAPQDSEKQSCSASKEEIGERPNSSASMGSSEKVDKAHEVPI